MARYEIIGANGSHYIDVTGPSTATLYARLAGLCVEED